MWLANIPDLLELLLRVGRGVLVRMILNRSSAVRFLELKVFDICTDAKLCDQR